LTVIVQEGAILVKSKKTAKFPGIFLDNWTDFDIITLVPAAAGTFSGIV
jgi:hypothetical protein